MTDLGGDEVHIAYRALVLLEGGDPSRVWRPNENRTITLRPAGVVGRVAKILLTVGGELTLAPGSNVANPEVVVPNERSALAVGRNRLGTSPWRAPGGTQARHLARIQSATAPVGLRTARQSDCPRRIDQNELGAAPANGNAITQSTVAQPHWLQPHTRHQRNNVLAQEALGARVAGGGDS